MDFSFTSEQEAQRQAVIDFARSELTGDWVARDAAGTFAADHWRKCAEFGVFGWPMPVEYGGSGYDTVTSVYLMEALGYACPDNGFTMALNGQIWSVQEPILRFGTDAQKANYLPRMISGELIGADGVTEPESGSDAFALRTTATRVDGGYVLNGRKTYIGMGPVAGVILTFATVNPDVGRWGVTAFLVDTDSVGLTLSPHRDKMGLRTGPIGDITFDDCFVPESALVAKEGAGAAIFNYSMQYERSFIFASHVGSMARQLEQAIAYANERQVYGQPISKFQAVANRLVNMKVRLETARMFLYKAAWQVDQGQPATMAAAMAKLVISEAFMENSIDAVRVHGGRGYMTEYGIERDLRDAVGGVIYGGTSDIQRNVIASLLGLSS